MTEVIAESGKMQKRRSQSFRSEGRDENVLRRRNNNEADLD